MVNPWQATLAGMLITLFSEAVEQAVRKTIDSDDHHSLCFGRANRWDQRYKNGGDEAEKNEMSVCPDRRRSCMKSGPEDHLYCCAAPLARVVASEAASGSMRLG